jgi:hypothetical protein
VMEWVGDGVGVMEWGVMEWVGDGVGPTQNIILI